MYGAVSHRAEKNFLSAGCKTLPYKGNLAQCRARFYTAPKNLSVEKFLAL